MIKMGCRVDATTGRNPFRYPQGSRKGATQVPASSQMRASETSRRSTVTDPSVPHAPEHDASSGNSSATLSEATATPPVDDDTPVFYVNAKQFHRIVKRREMRQFLDTHFASTRRTTSYLHESRHQHANRRPRGPGGQFLNAAAIAALAAQSENEDNDKEESLAGCDYVFQEADFKNAV